MAAAANPPADDGIDPLAKVPTTETAEPLPERAVLHTKNRTLLIVAVMGATIMQILDTTIANVALPHMMAELSATTDTITWALTSYLVASAVAIPITGWLADRVGSRNLFLIAVAGFTVASMLCGIAGSLPELVVFRAIQGLFAAFMNPLSQTAMLDVTVPSKQAGAMSIWGMGIMLGPILGPVLGGFLTEYYNWRWCFFVNLPVGIACFVLLWLFLPTRTVHRRSFDLFGFATLAVAVSSLQLMLDRGQINDWFSSWETRTEGMIAIACAWMFAIHLITSRKPLFDRLIFRDRNLVTGMFFMLINGLLMTATLALLPPFLQNLYGYPVITTGLVMMPRGFAVLASTWLVGRLMARNIDPRLLVGIGFSICAYSLWMMTGWTLEMNYWPMIESSIIQGVGLGMVFVPLNVMAFGTLKPELRTDGTSLLNLGRSVGGSLGISTVTTLLAQNLQINHQELGASPGLANLPVLGNDPVTTSAFGSLSDAALGMADLIVNQQAAMIAYLDDFKLMTIMTCVAVPMVLLLRPPRRQKPGEQKEKLHIAMD